MGKLEGRMISVTRNNTNDTRISRTTITRKQNGQEKTVWAFLATNMTRDISHEKTWTWLRKGNLKRETESLLIAAKNNTIKTNYIKARIDKTKLIIGYEVTETKRLIT